MEESDEIKRYYRDIERFDWATKPKRLSKICHARRERETVELIKRYFKGAKILDIGCGTGLITRHLNAALAVGLDINQWAIERAKVRSVGVDFVIADAESIPLRSNVFDAVTCTEVLEHLPQPEKAVEEIFRVLKNGGLFIGSVPNKNPVRKLGKYLALSSTSSASEPFHHSYSISQLKLFLSNFRIIEIRQIAFWLNSAFVAQKP